MKTKRVIPIRFRGLVLVVFLVPLLNFSIMDGGVKSNFQVRQANDKLPDQKRKGFTDSLDNFSRIQILIRLHVGLIKYPFLPTIDFLDHE